MLSRRHALRALAVLAALVLAVPGAAFAQSAGNQQYVDPLGGSTTTSPATTGSGQGSGPQTSSSPSASAPSTSAAASSGSTPASSASASTSAAQGTSTTSGSPGHSSGATLPFTGLDLWPAVAVGFGLIVSGLAIRQVARRS